MKKTFNMINEINFSNEDTVLIIRTFLNKAKRLLKINQAIKKEKNIDTVLTNFRPIIFWKDKDIVKKQVNNYSSEDALSLIDSINKTELEIKKNYNNSINILLDFILNQGKTISNKI